jgi:site-specific recombinase XerD
MEIAINLDLRKSGKTEKGYPIVVYVSKNYKTRHWRTGHFAKPSEWNEKLATPKSKHPQYTTLMGYLHSLKLRISNILSDHKNNTLGLEEIKELLFKKNYSRFYYAAMDSFPQGYKGTKWSAVNSFNNFAHEVLFEEVTKDMVLKYRDHLLRKGNKPGGVDSYIRSLRAVWNDLSNEKNPFSGIKIHIPEKVNTVATETDLHILKSTDLGKPAPIGGYANFRNYWLLMFYLGGIDPEVLAKLRYDVHVINGRIIFNRDKGGSKTACSNLIPTEAMEILEQYNCAPYLVPIYKSSNYDVFRRNFSRRMKILSERLQLSTRLKPKSARYTFIDRAQQLLVDERVTAQIVGHKRKTTTSIYTNDFPLSVQDKYHKQIILF